MIVEDFGALFPQIHSKNVNAAAYLEETNR